MKLIPTTINPVTITLYRGVPFDNNYKEHTLLSQQFKLYYSETSHNVGSDKEAFINMKDTQNNYIYPRTTKTDTFNFAFGNGLVTSVVMELTGDEINSNYMKVVSGSDSYYYFITGIIQKNELTYLLNLELDVFMTYSEEFLTNIKSKPVQVERKHCRRRLYKTGISSPVINVNMACFNQESTFSNFKSNIVFNKKQLKFTEYVNGANDYNDILSNLKWIYIIYSKDADLDVDDYSENNITYPYKVCCIPAIKQYRIAITSTGYSETFTSSNILEYFVANNRVQKIILSPFPPFKVCDNLVLSKDGEIVVITASVGTGGSASTSHTFYTGSNDSGTFIKTQGAQSFGWAGAMWITNGYGGKYRYTSLANYFDVIEQQITDTRDSGEFKLQIKPFKDLRLSSYYGGEWSIPTQMLFKKDFYYTVNNVINPYTIASSSAENNAFFDYVDLDENDVDSKRGISNAVGYTFPTGSNAEQIYIQSAKSQYETSRTINAISGGVQIVGGILGVALGGTMGKVAGAVSIASGVLGEGKNIAEWSSKMEDLKNTPNSYNFAGNSLPYDMALSVTGFNQGIMLPYLIEYRCDDLTYNIGAEFLYHYGYEYNAESYFATDIYRDSDNIFERRLFNYVKIGEDITTKLVGSNLPVIVAKKMNEILNAGITFWTFFKMDLTNASVVSDVITKYFQKDIYCNAELVS